MKRVLCWILSLLLFLTGTSLGEDTSGLEIEEVTEEISEEELSDEELSEEDLAILAEMGEADEDETDGRDVYSIVYNTDGPVYEEPTLKDYSSSSPAIYTGSLIGGRSIYAGNSVDDKNKSPSEQKPTSKKLYTAGGNTTVDILYVGLQWMIVRLNSVIGYTKRSYIAKNTVKALDPENTPDFNVQKHAWVATCANACPVRATMDASNKSNVILTLNEGSKISIWKFQDGWAIVNFWKTYAYIQAEDLTDLIPVSPTDEPLSEDSPIAAYTSYYKIPAMMSSPEAIEKYENRCWNIKLGSGFISGTLQPGEVLDANARMGHYNAAKGYKVAGVLAAGGSASGYGGGTCQVASTLYNVVIQLPGLTVLKRHPHGGDGACSYLPCHCDAAVGNSNLNFRFRNDYDFPIRVEYSTFSDGALLMMIYRAD